MLARECLQIDVHLAAPVPAERGTRARPCPAPSEKPRCGLLLWFFPAHLSLISVEGGRNGAAMHGTRTKPSRGAKVVFVSEARANSAEGVRTKWSTGAHRKKSEEHQKDLGRSERSGVYESVEGRTKRFETRA